MPLFFSSKLELSQQKWNGSGILCQRKSFVGVYIMAESSKRIKKRQNTLEEI